MLDQQIYALTEPTELRTLIEAHGWVTLVSALGHGDPQISHLPLITEPDADGLTVVGHLARTDALRHELGAHDVAVVVEGPNGYISPTMYQVGPHVPTWNFVVAHLYGRPTLLGEEETYDVLRRTVDHFEAVRPRPWRLDSVTEYARALAGHTTAFRLRPSRVVGKRKLSQEEPREVALRVMDALDGETPHGNPALAEAMRQVLVPGE
ncbi:FMN-binding negative transcriptional regulator [Streptomyces sp. NPDC087420]|uniref:FMN-binding negative transcriptional regulator n=1 Tax=Streptomyces sp. NPDC087420 TaxID=3365785 RepID=UPI003839972A